MMRLSLMAQSQSKRLVWAQLALPSAFVVMCIALAVVHPRFLSPLNMDNVSRQAAFLMILSAGQTFAIISGGIDLSSGAVVSVVGIVTTLIVLQFGIAPGVAAGLLAGAILGSINGAIIARLKLPPMIVTLAMSTFGAGLALTITGGMPVQQVPMDFSVIGRGWIGPIPIPVILAVLVTAVSYLVLRYTRFGRHVYAVGANEDTALLSGISVRWRKLQVYTMAGLMAGLAGIALSSLVDSGQPRLGEGMEFQAIAAVALGGTKLGGGEGGVISTAFGVLFVSVLANGLNLLNVPTYSQWLAMGAALIAALLLQRAGR